LRQLALARQSQADDEDDIDMMGRKIFSSTGKPKINISLQSFAAMFPSTTSLSGRSA